MIGSARSAVREDLKAAFAAAGLPKERVDWSAWNIDAPVVATSAPGASPGTLTWVRPKLVSRRMTAVPAGLWGSPTMREFDLLISFFVRRGTGEADLAELMEDVLSYFRRRVATSDDGAADLQYRDPDEPEHVAVHGGDWAQYNAWLEVWVWDRTPAA